MSIAELGLYVPTGHDIDIPMPHFVQRDNTGGEGYRECFMTSVAMCADYLLKGHLTKESKRLGLREPEDVYHRFMDGDTTDSSVHIRALKRLGIKSYFSTTASINDLMASLYRGCPVVIGMKYRASGHMGVVDGRTSKGLRLLCPNGIRLGSSNNWIERFVNESSATPDMMSWSLVKKIFTDLGDEAGWALFFTEIKGISTEVPLGL